MRCLALAQHWRDQGGKATFLSFCESASLRKRIESEAFFFHPIQAPYPHLNDLQTVQTIFSSYVSPWMVIDGYHFDATYQSACRALGYKTLIIDDTAHQPCCDADVLLNQNIHAHTLNYTCPPGTVFLLGLRYALLRSEFLKFTPKTTTQSPPHILVTLGGSDPGNVTGIVIQALKNCQTMDFHARIVVGPVNPHLNQLKEAVSNAPNLELCTDVSHLSEHIAWADVAISASGTTTWELLVMGVPTLSVIVADNQFELAQTLSQLGAIHLLGLSSEITPLKIEQSLLNLLHNPSQQAHMRQMGKFLIDGLGAQRVVQMLTTFENRIKQPMIRHAEPTDALLLYRWANDPIARSNSFHKDPTTWPNHLKWYAARLSSPDTRIWILERETRPLGLIRYDRITPDTASISFQIDHPYRGQGMGSLLLQLTAPKACQELQVSTIEGTTFATNEPSARAFLKAGFKMSRETVENNIPCRIFTWFQTIANP